MLRDNKTNKQGFTFEDPGGWCTTGYFDLAPLASNPNLRQLNLQLVTYECEHCEGFELSALHQLTQLHSLSICIASPTYNGSGGGSSGGSSGRSSTSGGAEGPELLLVLPLLKPARRVAICSSMRVVLRNSKVLARARFPGVLAQSIMLEEPRPQRAASAGSSSSSKHNAAGTTATADTGVQDTAGSPRDQASRSDQQQYVRAPAHVVISALRELWPGMEVWQYSVNLPGSKGSKAFEAELCCHSTARHSMQQQLTETLRTAVASMVDEKATTSERPSTRRFAGLW